METIIMNLYFKIFRILSTISNQFYNKYVEILHRQQRRKGLRK